MSLNKFNNDMNIIAKLDDEPNDVGGLSAAELKEKFDEGGNSIKRYINESLIPEIETKFEDISKNTATKEDLAEVVLGQIPDGSITAEKLAPGAINSYTKEQSLSPETKTLFGLPESAVPDDAFKKTAENIEATKPRIGDIMTTMRTDLGNNWLLCNGGEFTEKDYPELAKLCPDLAARCGVNSAYGFAVTGYNTSQRSNATEGNGYLACVSSLQDGSYYYPYIYWSKDNGRTWGATRIYINEGLTTNPSYYHAGQATILKYIDGMWIMALCYQGYLNVYTTNDIESHYWPCVSTQIGASLLLDFWKEGDLYYIAAAGGSSASETSVTYPVIASTPDIKSQNWSILRPVTDTNVFPQSFLRANGQYAFFCQNGANFYVVHTKSLSMVWTKTASNCGTNTGYPVNVVYDETEGIWAYIGFFLQNSICYYASFYTDSLDATEWNKSCAFDYTFSNDSTSYVPFMLAKTRGTWISISAGRGKFMLIMPSLTDATTWIKSPKFGYVGGGFVTGLRPYVSEDESVVLWPLGGSASNGYYNHFVPFYPLGVPEITADQSYVYIKAKEDA